MFYIGIIWEMYAHNQSIVVFPLILQYLQKPQTQKEKIGNNWNQ